MRNSVFIPGISAQDKRRGRLHGALDAGRVAIHAALAPADQSVVCRQLDNDIGNAVTADQIADLFMGVRHIDRKSFQFYDFHRSVSVPPLI